MRFGDFAGSVLTDFARSALRDLAGPVLTYFDG